MPARPSRRTVVAAALAVPATAASGCSLSGPTPPRPAAERSPDVDPDVALLDQVTASTAAMVTLYEDVLERHRGLRRDLRPLLDAHRAHAGALGEAAPPAATAPRSRRRETPGRRDVPGRPDAAVRVLSAAERRSSSRLLDATRRAASGPFARLLAAMSASSAQHLRVLDGVRGR